MALPCIAKLLPPSGYDCLKKCDPDCTYGFCEYCCITSAQQVLLSERCNASSHRVQENQEPWFQPDYQPARRSIKRPQVLPICSPLSGQFEKPAGRAWADLILNDWETTQADLRATALERLPSEGVTVFVFIWSEVSAHWNVPRSSSQLFLAGR